PSLPLTLLFLLFGSPRQCSPPQAIDYAGFFTERYAIGTLVRYVCEKGYSRKAGESNLVKCKNESGHAKWMYRFPPACRENPSSSSLPVTRPPSSFLLAPLGFCGAPSALKHAKMEVAKYGVGQELHYRCLDGHRARTPICEVRTCGSYGGKGVWSRLALQCMNSSKAVGGTARTLLSTGNVRPGRGFVWEPR
uniref:Interleukin-2 receptor subunit alpha n=1 Tax=Varanus komodoensis TaxID=61221 RepID=A0A8D2Q2F3_VARKO